MGQDGQDGEGHGLISRATFDQEIRDDTNTERKLFWKGILAAAIVVVVMYLRQRFFV